MIAAAALFTWVANKRVTFAILQITSVGEVVHSASVAISAVLLYCPLFSVLTVLRATRTIAIAAVALLSYFGFRRVAFGKPSRQ